MQLDLPSGDRLRLHVEARMEEEPTPEGTLIYDTLSETLKEILEPEEFARLEKPIRKIDWHLDLIHRDRKIKEEIRQLTAGDTKMYEAVRIVAGRYHLSEEHIYTIWYGKQAATG